MTTWLALAMVMTATLVWAGEALTTLGTDLPQFPHLGQQCKTVAVCDKLAKVDCNADHGGRLLYVQVEKAHVKANCPQTCDKGFNRKFCMKNCPPKEWTCEK